MGSAIPLLLVVVVFVLLIIVPYRRQAQRQRDVRSMQAALQPGTDVMTTSGLFGTIVGIDERFAELEIADGVVIRVARAAIGEVVKPSTAVLDGQYAAIEGEDHDETDDDDSEYEDDDSEYEDVDAEYEEDEADDEAEYEDDADGGEDQTDQTVADADQHDDGTEPRKGGSTS